MTSFAVDRAYLFARLFRCLSVFEINEFKSGASNAFASNALCCQKIDTHTHTHIHFFKSENPKGKNRKTTFIITGHAEGSQPKTQLERDIKFDANQKVYVEGLMAKCQGRTIGPNGGDYIVWKEGYEKLNGAL